MLQIIICAVVLETTLYYGHILEAIEVMPPLQGFISNKMYDIALSFSGCLQTVKHFLSTQILFWFYQSIFAELFALLFKVFLPVLRTLCVYSSSFFTDNDTRNKHSVLEVLIPFKSFSTTELNLLLQSSQNL